ncbi:50S ribosomal protein L19 [Oligosphaera ethanolica]|jgi:large subunit ribosomal protein L19|uniref:Large ribosomal subunit protein bL19 n=1 Tax=Oligosphaera ethanolica TaxID=760260 RepID=A0AAE3VF60_9BACT|nr:50S ribosomal protein L19 [Oligosphaera ethanolica]MDQ0289161.1 large subunit ribosomal protein L19 [Oligosphaera ethanolica]
METKKSVIEELRQENLKPSLPEFGIGDTIQVDVRIIEGGKERIQAFTGTVIARNGGGISESVTLRRVSHGQGVERVIPLHSPRIASFKRIRQGSVRRAKLYYLRDQVGNAATVKEKRQR